MESKYKYYYPDGTEIENQEEFIHFYSKGYYYLNRDLKLEKRIEEVLLNGIESDNDIVDILKWKTGATEVDYEENYVKHRWGIIETLELSLKIKEKDFIFLEPKKIVDELLKIDKIGPVYALTLLYFITKGEFPIYDKYAHLALIVIESKEDFSKNIADKDLYNEFKTDSLDAEKIFDLYCKNYIERLKYIFGEKYKKNRDIDRALWTYGHLFNDIKSNKNR